MAVKKTAKRAKRRESIINNEPKLIATFEPGDVSLQGDLLIVCIKKVPTSAKPRKNRQLADGNTQGSRHVLERGDVFDAAPEEVQELILASTGCRIAREYLGPVFMAPSEPTDHDLTHPEHGHQGFPAGSVSAVVFQRSLDAEEREVRVVD